MPATARLALPYPALADTADVPRDIQALATKLDPSATAFVQGTAAARPAASIAGRLYWATDTSVLSYDTGTAWANISGPTVSNVPVVSALPTVGLVDGQEVNFQTAAMALDGVMWRMRYRAGAAGWGWEYVGGGELVKPQMAAASTTGTGSTWSTTIGDGTNACSLTAPLAGDYMCTWTAIFYATDGTVRQSGVGLGRPGDSAPSQAVQTFSSGGNYGNLSGSGRIQGVAAGGLIAMFYLYSGAILSFASRGFTMRPIRVLG